MTYNQKGFSSVRVIIGIILVGVLIFAGWKVYDAQSNSASQTSEQSSKDGAKVEIPKDWVRYENTEYRFSFSHPKEWDTRKFTVRQFVKDQAISSEFGTPSSVVFVSSTNTWTRFLNYGDPESQEPIGSADGDEDGLQVVAREGFAHPFAYMQVGQTTTARYDLYFANDAAAFAVSLPTAGSELSTEARQQMLNEQKDALPAIIQSFSFPS